MKFQKEYLDLLLVPSGLVIMFGYHLWLLYRCLHRPDTTVIGFENKDKKEWVDRIMQVDKGSLTVPLNVISYNISASTYLSAVCLTLCALIGTWFANNSKIFQGEFVYGDTRTTTMSIKYITVLICFLLAFACFVSAARSLIHATYLISMPNSDVPIASVELARIRGGDFWSLGIRAIYFALVLLLWFLGPIPMFATSVGLVIFLHYLDTNMIPTEDHRRRVSVKKNPMA